eukprot:4045309-Pyramimonas_sp.AAC.2
MLRQRQHENAVEEAERGTLRFTLVDFLGPHFNALFTRWLQATDQGVPPEFVTQELIGASIAKAWEPTRLGTTRCDGRRGP